MSRLTTKSTCRQQNTMPLKDEQVPELHGKMPNVTSETVEKTIVFGGFTATAGCYCYLLPAIVHQKQLPTTSYPTSYSDLWTAPCWCASAAATTLVFLLLLLLLLLPYCRWLLAADCCLLATIAAGCWRLARCCSTL